MKREIDNSTTISITDAITFRVSIRRFANIAPQTPIKPIKVAAIAQPQITQNDIVSCKNETSHL